MKRPPHLKILVANRLSLFCKGFKSNFNRKVGFKVEQAQCASELFSKLNAENFHMLYVQDVLPDLNIQAAVPLITAQHPGIKIIVHTDSEDPEYFRALSKIGIHGIMSPDAKETLIPVSIDTVYSDEEYYCPTINKFLINTGNPLALSSPKIIEANLSGRQQETLTGQLQGKTRAQIAHKMGIKTDTLRNHIKAMRKKLNRVGLLSILPDFDRQAQKNKK